MHKVRVALVLFGLTASLILPITASAVSANPTPVCSGANCTITFTYTGDIYQWTVPSGTTSLSVNAKGGMGGDSTYASDPGKGAIISATISVTPGSVLKILVGGQGQNQRFSAGGGGGGGGTFVTTSSNSPLIVVGGGGGAGGRNGQDGRHGSLTTSGSFDSSGQNTVGTNGSGGGGGVVMYGGGGGGGISGNGGSGTQNANGGFSFINGGAGGVNAALSGYAANGAYGGGGASGFAGGGGGGYSGGAGGYGNEPYSGGGGGGSFIVSGSTSISTSTGSYDGSLTFGGNSISNLNVYNSGAGEVAITYLNAPTPTTFSTSQTTPTNISTGTSIAYSLILSQSVSDLAVGDFQFGGTSSCNAPTLSGSGTTYTVNITNCSEGTLILQLKANSVTGTSTGPPSVSSANTIVVDRTAPNISGVVSTPAGATYIPGNSLSFQFQMNETVTVSGAPRIPIVVGNVTKYATYASGSNSPRLVFTYTVGNESAEFDTDGIAMTSPLELNSGSIQDLAGNSLVALTYSTTSTASVLVAQPAAAPTIDSITASSGTLTVYFTAGAPRGSTTTNYQFSTNNGSSFANRTSGTTASPLVISSLSNGTSYTVRIRAVTNAGNSDSSTSVTATPSAVVVTGDATLTLTYGQSASTSTYSSIGGTSPYTYSLSASVSGVSINSSNGTVTASSTTPAGTYIRNVVATDSAGTPQSGTRQLTITVNKASTSISISLPNSATEAALGGAITITATLTQSGSVNFRLGGSSISGCSSVASSGSTATCSWTPSSLGGASLSAIFTPSDSSNYEAATSTTLSITVVNGVSTVSLSLAGGVTQVVKGQVINMIAAIDQVGRVTFLVDGKRIPGCFNLLASSIGNRTCAWKPVVQKTVNLSARLVPSNNVFNSSTANLTVQVVRRSGAR